MSKMIYLSSRDFVSGDPSFVIRHPWVQHPDTEVIPSAAGDFKWITMTVPLRDGDVIRGVTIGYFCSNAESYISQIRLSSQTTPEKALVVHDDGTDLRSTSPELHTSKVGGVSAKRGSICLSLRLRFAGSGEAHKINLGAVIIDLE